MAVRLDFGGLQLEPRQAPRRQRADSVRQEVRRKSWHAERPLRTRLRGTAGPWYRTRQVDGVGLGEGREETPEAKERRHCGRLLRPELHPALEERRRRRLAGLLGRHLPVELEH